MAAIDVGTITLPIGPEGAADVRSLVPSQAQPMKGIENRLFRAGGAALLVRILNAQYKCAAVLFCKTKIYERDIRGAYVRIACR